MNDFTDPNHPANLPAEAPQHAVAVSPFERMQQSGGGMNHAVVAIEQERAIAEAQGQMVLAKRFPRSMAQAIAEFRDACKIPEFAAVAFYAVPNRGSGPSIRFAEEAARCYGNFQYGHVELSRDKGKSVVQVYAWDVERGNRSVRQLTVEHIVDTKNGPKKLTDQADIDNRIANVASKQIRGRILALLPKALVQIGQEECKKTLAGNNDRPIAQRVNDMVAVFSKFGVGIKHLEAKLGHALDVTTADELVELVGIYNALKEGAKASEYFELPDGAASTAAALTNQAKAAAASAPAAAAPAPAAPAAQQAAAEPTAQKNSKPAQQASKPAKAPAPQPAVEPLPPAASDEPDMPPAPPATEDDVF